LTTYIEKEPWTDTRGSLFAATHQHSTAMLVRIYLRMFNPAATRVRLQAMHIFHTIAPI
jgi:hypothetical protein